jgi:hypothetical protein
MVLHTQKQYRGGLMQRPYQVAKRLVWGMGITQLKYMITPEQLVVPEKTPVICMEIPCQRLHPQLPSHLQE